MKKGSKKGMQAQRTLTQVIRKHGPRSPIVRAIRAAIITMLVTTPLWIGVGVGLAGFDFNWTDDAVDDILTTAR